MLSESDFDIRPHFMMDFKRDELISAIPYAKQITTKDKVPKQAGLYRVLSGLDDPHLENFLGNIWNNGNAHIHIDETYMVPARSAAFNAILTQGRSLRINMNCLSQRPSMCSRWIPSEAKNFYVFHMNDERDKKTISAFMPQDKVDLDTELPRYHAHWFNSPRRFYTQLTPVPETDIILERFNERLKPKRRFL